MRHSVFLLLALCVGCTAQVSRVSKDPGSVFFPLLSRETNGGTVYQHRDSVPYNTVNQLIPFLFSKDGAVSLYVRIQYADNKALNAFQYIYQSGDEKLVLNPAPGTIHIQSRFIHKEWYEGAVSEDEYLFLKNAVLRNDLQVMYRGRFLAFPYRVSPREITILREVMAAYDTIRQGQKQNPGN